MKIGILTFHRPINYGAYLQAFSLQDRLKEYLREATIEIVDYIAPKERKKSGLMFFGELSIMA